MNGSVSRWRSRANKKRRDKEIVSCCNDCGRKRYKIKREAGAITVCIRQCPICKKEKLIIPTSDWEFMMGSDEHWD